MFQEYFQTSWPLKLYDYLIRYNVKYNLFVFFIAWFKNYWSLFHNRSIFFHKEHLPHSVSKLPYRCRIEKNCIIDVASNQSWLGKWNETPENQKRTRRCKRGGLEVLAPLDTSILVLSLWPMLPGLVLSWQCRGSPNGQPVRRPGWQLLRLIGPSGPITLQS